MHDLFDKPFWGRGFRPFFFCAALFSVLSLCLWGGFYLGYVSPPMHIFENPVLWHAHEMIFGFSMAVAAGFLLTAVANWTGSSPTRHVFLAGLVLLWLLGRLVMLFDFGFPSFLNHILLLSFVPAFIIALAFPLICSWNKKNFVFLSILSVIFLSNVWFVCTADKTALYLPLMMVVLMVSLIGGRIIPAFTVSGLRRRNIEAETFPQPLMDAAALLSIVVVAVCLVFLPQTLYLTFFAFGAAIVHAVRMRYYNTLKTIRDPMLWILHLGYLWLIVGFILLGLSGAGFLELYVVVHALTIGCIGSMCIGMMCRVTLGHTGRNLYACNMTLLSFVFMQIAALTRVFGTILFPEYGIELIGVSSLFWVLSFGFYLWVYTPMLFTPRPDGAEV